MNWSLSLYLFCLALIVFSRSLDNSETTQSNSSTTDYFLCVHKPGLRSRSDLLKHYRPTWQSNLALLLTLAGDVETHPGPKCGMCNKPVKRTDPSIQCDDCDKWIHALCASVNDEEYRKLGECNDDWFCPNCSDECGICSGPVLHSQKSVQCDSCNLWIHNSCSFISDLEYDAIDSTSCYWICPQCEVLNFSDSFFETTPVSTENRFEALSGPKQCVSQKRHKITGLKLMTVNINGIRSKKLDLLALLDVEKPDVVAIQETKIDSSVSSSELFPSECGYTIYRKDRTLHGGGVLLLVNSKIPQMPVSELDNSSESVWARILVNGVPHFVCSWYRPPNMQLEDFHVFGDQLDQLRSMNSQNKTPNVHVMGDFNFRNVDWNTGLGRDGKPLSYSDGKSLTETMNDHGLEQLVRFPTREQNTLDLIISSLPGMFENIESIDRLSDHDVVTGTLKVVIAPKRAPRRQFFLYSKGDFSSMRADAKSFASEKYFNGYADSRGIEQNWTMIKSFLSQVVSKYVPSKVSKSASSLPWITGKIRKLIRKRKKLHARGKRTGSAATTRKWKQLRRDIKDQVKSSHEEYVNNMIGDVDKDPKAFWKYINRQKKDSQAIPPLKVDSGRLAESDKDKAEALNSQFSSVFTRTESDSVPYLPSIAPKMDDIHVTEAGVRKLLQGLNPSKASGPDEIHPRVLKELAVEISPVIAHIFRQSLDSGSIPKDWSEANICPLYKKGDRATASNYRPVSLTCILCKLLEHIVCSNIMGHVDKYGLLTEKQHAFRRHHSCETQLVTVVDDWSRSLDRGEQVDVFIMDLEKAFDTPPHELLKAKLCRLGIKGKVLNWIDSFLCYRSQRVVVNGEKSGWEEVVSGVPQGTVLGPILFSLYINDMIEGIQSDIRLFADDCVCYREIRCQEDREKLQDDIDRLGRWARKWGMRFQPSKCNMITLSRKRTSGIGGTYTLEGKVLEAVDRIKYLGVTICSDLRWNTHIENVCNKANRTLGLLRRNLSSCPLEVKEKAYIGLVRPILEYASSVWDPNYSGLQEELEKVQNRAARFVTGNYRYDPGSMTEILKQLGWKSLTERRKEARLVLLYKGMKGEASIQTKNLVKPSRDSNRTHHKLTLRVPHARTNCYKFSFFPSTIRDLNLLPPSTINAAEESSNQTQSFTTLVRNCY